MMTLTEKLNRVVDAYCAHVRRSRSRVSFIVFGDGSRLDGIAAGKDLNTRSWERAMAWFSANWPEGLDWPAGVERPEAATSSALPLTPALSPAGRGGDAAEAAP